MSILVGSGVPGVFTSAGFISSAQGIPVSLGVFVKVDSFPSSGFAVFDVIKLDDGTANNYYLSRFYNNGSSNLLAARIRQDGGTAVTEDIDLTGQLAGAWHAAVAVFQADGNFALYTKNGSGTLLSASLGSDSARRPSGVIDLKLLDGTWSSDVRAEFPAFWQAELTTAQIEEFIDTGDVAGLTPYARFDTATDWATTGGQILDTSGNARHITPPVDWTYSADAPAVDPIVQAVRKGSTLTVDKPGTLGTITTATLNAVDVFDHLTAQDATTATFAGALTDEIATSGEYDLVLGDGTVTETVTIQINVFGVAPSNNPVQKDGAALASLTGVQIRVTSGANINGTELFYSGAATTDASGNLSNIDLSSTAAADTDPVLLHMRTAAGDSIIASETVGLI